MCVNGRTAQGSSPLAEVATKLAAGGSLPRKHRIGAAGRRVATGRWLALWRGNPPNAAILALAGAGALLAVIPIAYVLMRAAQAGAARWLQMLDSRIPALMASTANLTAAVTAAAIVLGVALAWLVVRTDLPGRRLWQWVLALPLAVPPYVGSMAYVVVLGPIGWVRDWLGRPLVSIYSFWGAALVLVLFTYPYVFLIASAVLKRLDPRYEEVALTTGMSRRATFWRVTLPFLRPAVGAGGVLVALYVLSDFGAVGMLRYTTFTTAIYYQMGNYDLSGAAVLSVMLMSLSLVLLWIEGRSRERLVVHQAGGMHRPPPIGELGGWKAPALAFVLLVFISAVLLPLGVLMYWTGTGGTLGPRFWRYAANSLLTAGPAAAMAMALALPVVYLRARHPSTVSRLAHRAAQAGYALPGVIVALGLVVLFNRYLPALYGTAVPVVVAYVIRYLPQTVRAGEAAISVVPASLDEAARSLGLSPWQASVRVVWPLIRPGLLAGGLLVLVSALKELPATLLLRPPGLDTLAVRVWIEASEGYFQAAAPLALLIVALSILPLRWMLRDVRS